MKPEVKVFTRGKPCTKRDIWECFAYGPGKFRHVQVDEAHALIGKNVPRGMMQMRRLVRETVGDKDVYILTSEGRRWLTAGIASYVKNHPAEAADIPFLPTTLRPTGRRVRTRWAR